MKTSWLIPHADAVVLLRCLLLSVSLGAIQCEKPNDAPNGRDLGSQRQAGQQEATLRVALLTHDLDEVRRLLSEGVDVNAQDPRWGMTLLDAAAQTGKMDAVQLLLEAGSDPSMGTPVYHAVLADSPALIRLFAGLGASLDKGPRGGRGSPLVTAIILGHDAALEALLEHGADVNSGGDDAETPLLCATRYGRTSLAAQLILAGADVNAGDGYYSPIHGAAEKGHVEVAKLLIEAGADVDAQAANGKTALEIAREGGNTEIVKLLERQ
jgi:ankyrin repeat protein